MYSFSRENQTTFLENMFSDLIKKQLHFSVFFLSKKNLVARDRLRLLPLIEAGDPESVRVAMGI